MESLAAFPDGEWDSFNKMFFADDELDLTQFSFPSEHAEGLSFRNSSSPNPEANMSITEVNESLLYSCNALHSDFHSNSLETYHLDGSYHIALTNDLTMSSDVPMDTGGLSDKFPHSFPPAFSNIAMEATVNVVEDLSTDCLGKLDAASQQTANVVLANELLVKRKFDALELHAEGVEINSISTENTKKRPRVLKDAPKVYNYVQNSKKKGKNNLNGNEGEYSIVLEGQSSSITCSSEDDNVSQDTNGVATSVSKASQALNSNGKTRASRGSATDPQSLYARKRRERINERLRILQNLVPNGTKVDISTMLEEAVHYVKFLQLQIKLLSSDDLWMYAPIAYNGIDIGLNNKISTLQ